MQIEATIGTQCFRSKSSMKSKRKEFRADELKVSRLMQGTVHSLFDSDIGCAISYEKSMPFCL